MSEPNLNELEQRLSGWRPASDGLDGFMARRQGTTRSGAFLDPLADKAMLVSIFIALGLIEAVPRWLVILVVSRDIMIVGAVILAWLVHRPIPLKPLLVSKLNTVAQIALVCVILAALGFDWSLEGIIYILIGVVAVLTFLSVVFYVVEWVRHMNAAESER